jgi:DEAD/DEAH box helicase domain-containing protein
VHAGAVYVHQGVTHVITNLDLLNSVAFARVEEVDYTTIARDISDIRIVDVEREDSVSLGVTMFLGRVDVTNRVVSFQRRRISGENLGEEPLDLPERILRTQAVWWTLPKEWITDPATPGSVHGAEHAAIGMLPLFATCDRWDIGGVSTAAHPDTGTATIFIYDGHPGGAGFAAHGFDVASDWLAATRQAIIECACDDGCPGCIQSPKCGNGNDPLEKQGTVRVLTELLTQRPVRHVM